MPDGPTSTAPYSTAPYSTDASAAEVARDQYLAFSRTWAATVRQCGVPLERVEDRVVQLFHDLCRRIAPAVVLEVGAHEASFSRWAAAELTGARVLAFEANPHVHEKFAGRLAGTGVEYANLAVSSVAGPVVLHLPTEVAGRSRRLTSRMASLAQHTRATDETTVSVPSVRLDDHVALGEGDRVVAWIDVEGANETVLGSGRRILDRTDAVYIEVEHETTWHGQWLDSDVALCLREHGLVPLARDLKRTHQHNVLFVRSSLACDPAVTRQAAATATRRRQRPPQDEGQDQHRA